MSLASVAVRLYGAAARIVPFERESFRSLFSAAYFANKRFEDPFAALIAARPDLFLGGNVLDIGANIGYTALLFARAVRPPFVVHALEPHPGCATTLRRNVERSPLRDRVSVHAVAAGATPGSARLSVNRYHPGDHRIVSPSSTAESLDVAMVRADDLIGGQPVAFAKIDVQGFELEVSRGMTAILDANPNIAVAFEYAPAALRNYGVDPQSLLDFYVERGFSLNLLDCGRVRETTASQISGFIRGENYSNILCLR
ncbi:MAG TPA: FkbM family methyltransferase [Thermoanaerobaculia bacterium]|nr:FkbM family methyltransferase [Thermoanaerobaculia bacterium]